METLILIFIAVLSNRMMDSLDHHWSKTRIGQYWLKKMQKIPVWPEFASYSYLSIHSPFWWNLKEGWKNKYVNRDPSRGRHKLSLGVLYPVQFTDAWHFFKMLMIFSMIGAVVSYNYYWLNIDDSVFIIPILAHFVIYGVWWNVSWSICKLILYKNRK